MQGSSGEWTGDKWNYSWLYTTCIALNALKGSVYKHSRGAALHHLISCQNVDGGFSSNEDSNMLETAFGLLALCAIREDMPDYQELEAAIEASHRWLLNRYMADHEPQEEVWASKQIYSPRRIDRMYVLSALVGTAISKEPRRQSGTPKLELAEVSQWM
jgi:hypothetical protein